ncbi:glycoside hydrolase family 9 protein [Aliiglaciecola sp. 2_MG-2023]|uniref:glycoside hydrolase family 9 protein n=1 Tax=unclassified Aliiglaciecola TaxID=2593648 RepID=UPI0026E1F4FD|nr:MULTISPECIES: glycoside hydrolase family 9 protein [unclassified Aliiglaciecola]MDO6710903.1 glycoside hydrolase family 9 protein [Aliiglaciecola sp. 2_MG-2023]MDO6752384.1 glycoside hydrolase family 9 protein [Aliiglaciecola sp. 1_MG-2023]
MLKFNQKTLLSSLICYTVTSVLIGCKTADIPPQPANAIATQQPDQVIQINQLGYFVKGEKGAIVPNTQETSFRLQNLRGDTVFDGPLSESKSWSAQGPDKFKFADFSEFSQPGTYSLTIKQVGEGVELSRQIKIDSQINQLAHKAALKYFYFNRAGMALTEPYAGKFQRQAGHLDQNVIVHPSAASPSQPAFSTISSPKGWYDAGDYGKYTVNASIATYTLLAAYADNPNYYHNLALEIPESNNQLPDIVDELMWNLEWLHTMQNDEGAVYHKLTTLQWPGKDMPADDNADRYVIGFSTSAALDYAATLAAASRILRPLFSENPEQLDTWLASAQKAWRWAMAHPNYVYQQPADVSSGEYGDNDFSDEFAWAGAELFLATKNAKYLHAFQQYNKPLKEPDWSNVAALGYFSLVREGKPSLTSIDFQKLQSQLIDYAEASLQIYENNGYGVAMNSDDYVWGSNSVVLNKAIMLLNAFRITGDEKYRQVAQGNLNFVFGRNPTGYSFLTGFGDISPQNPHHRISAGDKIDEPVPGMLAGGPQPGQQDKCDYANNFAAGSYVDDWCSYASNEVAINWNAPLVYVLGSLLAAE